MTTITTHWGTWRRFAYPNGKYFAEFRSHATFWGLPLLHYTRGICPETGRRVVAKGIVAVGRLAMGALAIGQASFGLIAIGQAGLGLLLGLGQVATGEIAIGQVALGKYVLAQIGFGERVWSMNRADPEAVAFFKAFLSIPSVMGGKKVQEYPVLRSRLRVQSEGKVPGGIG